MPFDPLDFFKLAKSLYQSDLSSLLKDATFRTVIGRLYYSCFLTYRELLRQLIRDRKYDRVASSSAAHSCVIRLIKKLDIYLGNFLSQLHQKRLVADYELYKCLDKKMIEESLAIAEQLLSNTSIQSIKQNYKLKRTDVQRRLEEIYTKIFERRPFNDKNHYNNTRN